MQTVPLQRWSDGDAVANRSWHGHWWLPEESDRRLPGVLLVEPNGTTSLELIGGFDLNDHIPVPGGNGYTLEGRTAPIVLGEAEGVAITLLDCFTEFSRGSDGQGRPEFHRVFVNRALIGVWLESQDDAVFRSARLQIEHLTSWLAAETVRTETNFHDDTANARLTSPPTESVTVDGWTYDIRAHNSGFQLDARRDGSTVRGDVTAYLWVKPAIPAAVAEYDRVANELTDLLTLSTGVACGLIDYTLIYKDDERWPIPDGREISRPISVEVIGRRIHVADPSAPALQRWEFRFTCRDLPFAEALSAWIPFARTANAACDVYFGTYYAPLTFTETKVLFAAIAAESLHNALYPSATEVPAEEFDALWVRIDELLDPADRDRLRRVLSNVPSFRARMITLAHVPAATAVEKVVPDVAMWSKDLRIARNGMAHGGAATSTDLFQLAGRSMSLIALVMMSRLGLSEEVQIRAADKLDD